MIAVSTRSSSSALVTDGDATKLTGTVAGRGPNDVDEGGRFQAGPAHQGAVHVRLGHQDRLAYSPRSPSPRTGSGPAAAASAPPHLGHHLADERAGVLGVRRGGRLPGADGPDRLVGDHQAGRPPRPAARRGRPAPARPGGPRSARPPAPPRSPPRSRSASCRCAGPPAAWPPPCRRSCRRASALGVADDDVVDVPSRASMSGLTSPVKAPASSSEQCWAPEGHRDAAPAPPPSAPCAGR